MDEIRFQELEAKRMALTNGADINDLVVNSVSSGMNAFETVGFIGDVGKMREEYEIGKSIYNGAIVQGGRGIVGTAKMLNELYAERAQENGYVKNKEDLMVGWNYLLDSSPLQRYETENNYVNALFEGGGQLLGQVGVGLVTGGVGSMAYMGAQIAGNQYLELKDKGVSTQRAAMAAGINAAIQMPLEKFGLDKILKGLPAGSPIRKRLMDIITTGASEGFTELVQEFPEQFTNLWAENPNLDAQGIARKWDENANENVKAALISGSIGAILGGGSSGLKTSLQLTVGRKIEQKVHESILKDTKSNIDNIKKTGVNPEYAAVAIDAQMRGENNVSVDAEVLQQYMQQTNAEKVAETLGVTTEEVKHAAEMGHNIDISYGKFVSTAVAQGDNFYNMIEDHISFEDANGYSTNLNNLTTALRKMNEITDKAKEELDIEVGMILESAVEAGVADAHTSGLKELLISRAMIANPENPAQFFKDHPLDFRNVGKIDNAKNIYKQDEDGNVTVKVEQKNQIKSADYNNGNFDPWEDNEYLQESSAKTKGAISWDAEGKAIINLFKGADASTVIHETGHYFLEAFMQDSALDTANEQMKKDRAAILKYAGLTEEQWQKADFEGRRAAHEKLTEAFETYIIEGKSPNRELRSVFKRFSQWLKAVYSSIINGEKAYDPTKRNPNAAEINDEVRQVFDRWFATEEEIKAVERIDGYFAKLPDVITSNLSERQQESIKGFIEKAHDKAVDLMLKDTMQIFTEDRKKEIEKIREQAKDRVEKDVKAQQVYKAIDLIHTQVPGWSRANAKTLARKYLSKGGQVYGDYATAKAGIEEDINERINPIIDQMYAGIDKNPRTYWIDKETNQEVDVSDLERDNADELKTGFQFQKVTEDKSAHWWEMYRDANGKRVPSRAKMRELAIQAYMGNDPYGILVEESQGLDIKQAEALKEEIAQRKAEMEELLKQEKMLKAQGYQANLFKKFYMSDEMRVWWDLAAERAGYDSGDAMAKDIQSKPTYKKAVEQYLDAVVDEYLPDSLKDPERAEQAAREALYNDDSGMVIAVEQQIIEDYANDVNAKSRSLEARTKLALAMKAAAENAAKAEMSVMRLKDAMKYRNFVKAERKAAANAHKALKAGDTELAVSYKRQQAFNHAMVRESLRIRQQVKKNLAFLKRQRKFNKDTWGYDYHFNQAANLLARMGIGRKDYDPSLKNQTLYEYVIDQVESGNNNIDIADWLMNETIDISSPELLTFDQYQDVINALKNIRAVALSERKQFAVAKEKNWAELKDDILKALEPLKDAWNPTPGERPKASLMDKFRAGMRTTDNLFELMDNWSYGWFSKHFGETLKHCADAEARMRMEFEKRATDAYRKWLPDLNAEKAADEKVMYEELGTSVDKHFLVQLAANLGNETNMQRLCGSVPVGLEKGNIWVQPSETISEEEAIELTRGNLVAFLGKVLTKEDIEYAQSKIENADRLWEDLAKVERRTKGFPPKRVHATPVAFKLADGSTVLMKGGYLPLVRDTQMGSHAASQNSVSDTDPNGGRNIQTLHTNTGSSKSRTNAQYEVALNRGAEIRAVMDTIHDICYRETIADFRKILNDQELYGILKTKLGVANFQQLRELLEKSANPYSGGTDQMEGMVAECASWLRRKTVNAAIMMNIKTSLQNISNINLFGNAVEGFTQKDAWGAVLGKYGLQAASLKQNDLDKFIMEKSVFMAERVLFPDITVKDIVGEGKQSKIEQEVTKWGAMMLAYTDNITAKPVWMAAYEKKINAGATEQEAIDFADTIIRRTLGSSRTQDVSSLMRGGPLFKLFTTFQGFWNTQYNQWEREAGIFRRDWSEGKRKEAGQRLAAFACAKWLSTCLMSVLLGLEDPFEEDEKENTKLKNEIYSYPLSMLGPFGQAANMMLNSLRGTSTYSYRLAAIQSTIDRFNKLFRTTNRVIEGKASGAELAEGLFSVAFPIVGLPDQANKILWNSYDYIFNDMDFRVHDIVARRPKSERKAE